MFGVTLGEGANEPLSLLCLGAHSDDIEIGCGGTLLRLLSERPGSSVHWVVFSADDRREAEARSSAASFLAGAGASHVDVHRFRESYFPYLGAEIKDAFRSMSEAVSPDVVFTHRRDDEHQDHRLVAELTWNSFRDHMIAEYEIPKYEGDLGHPNLYVPLPHSTAEHKVHLIVDHFESQHDRRWFRPETFRAMMSLRGLESNAPDGLAEAFHVRKLILGPQPAERRN